MTSRAAPPGPLFYELENVRVLAGLRRIVLVWQDPEGAWCHALRCREDMVPQAEARLLEDLFRVYGQSENRRWAWQEALRRWHADSGWFESFKCDQGAGFFAAFCESGLTWPQHTSEWLALTLPSMAAAANAGEGQRRIHAQRQAVLESALSLAGAQSETALLDGATRLAHKLFSADAAACLCFARDLEPKARCLSASPERPSGDAGRWTFDQAALDRLLRQRQPLLFKSEGRPEPGTLVPAVLLAVPLQTASSSGGVLALVVGRDSVRPYTTLDLSTFAVFCRQVNGVLENRRLLARLEAANRELTSAQAQLVESARLQTLGELAASVAHDFNNVLGALLGRVQLLQHAVSDAGIQASLVKMEKVIADGESTVKRLQEAARTRRADPSPTLAALVRDVYSTTESVLRNQAQIHDRKVIWFTEFLPTSTLLASPAKVAAATRQLLTDLSNQVPVDSVIEVRTRRQGGRDQLALTVASDPSSVAQAFAWETLPGYGAFATVLELEGGELKCECDDGVSTLSIRLAEGRARASSRSGGAHGLRVLVVDDEEEVREVLAELLAKDGHTVHTATDGADALAKFAADRFDIVFTDLGMPGISGWQVAEQMKRESPDLPVVMVTGWGHQLDPAQIEQSGVDRVLTKPFQWSSVLDALHELAGG